MKKNYAQSLERLQTILTLLRENCPWDKKQTIHSLSKQTIEELYELTDAIHQEDWENIKEEIGDLLLHLLFYTKIAEEQQHFTWAEVLQTISDKLVKRHPHIYDQVKVENEEQVKQNWEKIKLSEGKSSVLSGLPNSLPALNKAISIQEKVRKIGFDWEHVAQVKDKVKEEWEELEQAIRENDTDAQEEEFGDLLFSLVNYARFLNIDPEQALNRTNNKFKTRFNYMEDAIKLEAKEIGTLSLTELDVFWERAKKNLL